LVEAIKAKSEAGKRIVEELTLAKSFRFASAEALVSYLAIEFNEKQGVVDIVLWRFCADAGWL
jgi:hypothetical protein